MLLLRESGSLSCTVQYDHCTLVLYIISPSPFCCPITAPGGEKLTFYDCEREREREREKERELIDIVLIL